MTVVMKGGTSGNRDKNSIVSMPSPISQPLLDTSTNTMSSNVHFASLDKRGPHAAQQATPDFMPKGCTVPETGPDIVDPEA